LALQGFCFPSFLQVFGIYEMGYSLVILLQVLSVVGQVEMHQLIARPCSLHGGAIGKGQQTSLAFGRNSGSHKGIKAHEEKKKNPVH
jgi:hypothetical protein